MLGLFAHRTHALSVMFSKNAFSLNNQVTAQAALLQKFHHQIIRPGMG
jgi:hypothetical protein